MKTLIMYDSNYGNTRNIAEAMEAAIGRDSKALHVADCTPDMLASADLLLVGSPINGWQPTPAMCQFLQHLPKGWLDGIAASTFDTRMKILFHGDAKDKLAATLAAKGADIIAEPMAFYVDSRKGRLSWGELPKAGQWATSVVNLAARQGTPVHA